MSFLVSYNGQFSPLVTSVGSSAKELIHPVHSPHAVAPSSEFKELLATQSGDETLEPTKQAHSKLNIYKEASEKFEEKRKRFYAKDIMSCPVKLISETSPLTEARELMLKFGFRHLPVINQNNVITGLISDREISDHEGIRSCLEVMLPRVIVAEESAGINEIAIIFLKEKINALPIINHQHQVVGIITHSDILKYVVETTSFLGKA